MHNTPDYRGIFLRGLGGNSANLGELQKRMLQEIFQEVFMLQILDTTEQTVFFL